MLYFQPLSVLEAGIPFQVGLVFYFPSTACLELAAGWLDRCNVSALLLPQLSFQLVMVVSGCDSLHVDSRTTIASHHFVIPSWRCFFVRHRIAVCIGDCGTPAPGEDSIPMQRGILVRRNGKMDGKMGWLVGPPFCGSLRMAGVSVVLLKTMSHQVNQLRSIGRQHSNFNACNLLVTVFCEIDGDGKSRVSFNRALLPQFFDKYGLAPFISVHTLHAQSHITGRHVKLCRHQATERILTEKKKKKNNNRTHTGLIVITYACVMVVS